MLNIPSTNNPRVVIIGGGFGGINLAKSLRNKNFQVVLLDKNNYHLFQPLLYQVATGGLDPGSIAFPLRKFLKGSRNEYFRICEVKKIIPEKNEVGTSIGSLHYDYLVIATGTNTSYFGMENFRQHSLPMKTVTEALDIRSFVLENFEKAIESKDPKEKVLNQLMLDYPNIPYSDLAKIKAPIMIMSGDRDMIRPEHILKMFQHIPNSQLCILPGATHGGAWAKKDLFLTIMNDFFNKPFEMPDTKSWFVTE